MQLNKDFGFRELIEHLHYFSELGVTHLYISPILRARPGSTHCYDVFDFSVVNEELGGETWFRRLAQEAKKKGLGLLVDIVPNHMALENPYMLDVLEKGRDSEYADYFDIDWDYSNQVLLPILEEDLEQALQNIKIEIFGESALLNYKGLKLPLNSKSTTEVLNRVKKGEVLPNIRDVLGQQFYRLMYWKDAAQKINYRRFFEVNGLVALRQEEYKVFLDTHKKIFELVEQGLVSGIRVDHPDGLMNPEEYFRGLRKRVGGIYVVAEKILSGNEDLREWEIDGTTGYDFLRDVNSLFVDSDNEESMKAVYRAIVGVFDAEAETVRSKQDVLDQLFQGDVSRICDHIYKHTGQRLKETVELLLESMPVYRTYFSSGKSPDKRDLNTLAGILRFRDVEEVLGLMCSEVMYKLQQFEPAVMAKGFEDTFFYRYNLLVSLNEVGGDPTRFGLSCGEFHLRNLLRETLWPRTMITTSTHDTKLSEDVRARINVLSEVPDEWSQKVNEWVALNEHLKSDGFPDKNDEYRFYQVLLGTWNGYSAEYEERMVAYMLKAIREAKVHTSWLNTNERYEQATSTFVRETLRNADFMKSFTHFWRKIAVHGALNTLAQTVIKLTSPGVPDIYQGNETMSFSMVDPDNRRRVNFADLRENLNLIKESRPEQLLSNILDGKLKHYIVWRLLNLRRTKPQAFASYSPLLPRGEKKMHLCTYSRTGLTVVVPRLTTKLPYPPIGNFWAGTTVKLSGTHLDALTSDEKMFDGEAQVSLLLDKLPVAVLIKKNPL